MLDLSEEEKIDGNVGFFYCDKNTIYGQIRNCQS